ncbi:hypothetical protein ACFQZ4_20430 [Catellatospora coxensis]
MRLACSPAYGSRISASTAGHGSVRLMPAVRRVRPEASSTTGAGRKAEASTPSGMSTESSPMPNSAPEPNGMNRNRSSQPFIELQMTKSPARKKKARPRYGGRARCSTMTVSPGLVVDRART